MVRKSLKNVVKLIDAMTEQLPLEETFLMDLNRSIEMTAEKNKRTPSFTYKPSGMNCMRASYYQISGVPMDDEKESSVLIGITESGTDRHERIQQYICDMKNNGFPCEYVDVETFIKNRHLDYLTVKEKSGYETKLYWEDMNLSFLCDGIINYKNHYYILEIKTETSNKWLPRKGVDPKHYHQATAYSLAFGLPEVLFIYENRDLCDKKCFLLNVTEEMRLDLIGYISNCDSYLQEKKVPPKPVDAGPKFCQYCRYKGACNKDGG